VIVGLTVVRPMSQFSSYPFLSSVVLFPVGLKIAFCQDYCIPHNRGCCANNRHEKQNNLSLSFNTFYASLFFSFTCSSWWKLIDRKHPLSLSHNLRDSFFPAYSNLNSHSRFISNRECSLFTWVEQERLIIIQEVQEWSWKHSSGVRNWKEEKRTLRKQDTQTTLMIPQDKWGQWDKR
jgi:hypothetical protein